MKAAVAAVLLLAAALAPCIASAAGPLWQGTVGTSPVVVELAIDDEPLVGRYFYTRHRGDIALDGERQGAVLRLRETGGEWAVKPDGDALVGDWTDTDGRKQPVRLVDAHVNAVHDPDRAALAKADPYAYLRIAPLALRPVRRQAVGRYALQWYVEPDTDVELFQVVAGYTAAERTRLNRVLRDRHWSLVANAAECRAMEGGEYDTTTTLRRIAPDILSVSLFASGSCGGAHPDFGDGPLNLDPRTGRELALEDVLWLGRGTPPRNEEATQAAFFAYREHVLAPYLRDAMRRHHPRDMTSSDSDEDDCDYADAQVWTFPSWYVRADGLYLGPSFARVARACEYPDWTVLPWREVAAHRGAVRVGP